MADQPDEALFHKPTSRNDFKIAIVCALVTESSAVRAVFDKEWSAPSYGKLPNDSNVYTHGSISGHNVVLVHLPSMGGIPSATATANLRLAYPSVALALLVGICGGNPVGEDGRPLRLGDVVISTSVVQYTYGGRYPDRIRRKDTVQDSLSRSNAEIRAFFHKLMNVQERKLLAEGTQRHVDRVLRTTDFRDWKRPDPQTEQLFPSTYRHKHQIQGICSVCDHCLKDSDEVCDAALKAPCSALGCKVDQDKCYTSGGKTCEEDISQVIHFGVVASADQVMKSGTDRDKIAKEEHAIAFEMEGAGCWDNLPTIVIKGVCDYADSHKNKEWQKYASATAAGCTKAWLSQWVASEATVDPRLNHTGLALDLEPPQGQAKRHRRLTLSTESGVNASTAEEVIDTLWFRGIDDRYDDVEEAHTHTFGWIFDEEKHNTQECLVESTLWNTTFDERLMNPSSSRLFEYTKLLYTKREVDANFEWDPCALKSWLREGEGIFWISGKPGCGKSTLMKHIDQDPEYFGLLQRWAKQDTLLMPRMFFWRAGSEMQKSHLGLLQSLLYQILKQAPELASEIFDPSELNDLLSRKNVPEDSNKLFWSIQEAKKVFKRAIALPSVKMCIMIDGLDEFSGDFYSIAEYLQSLTRRHSVKILLSARSLSEFKGTFHGYKYLELHDWTRNDIEMYVRGRLLENDRLRNQAAISQDHFTSLVMDILDKAEGVFMWVKTAVSTLLDGFNKADNLEELSNRLHEFPKELNDLYESILVSLDPRYAEQTKLYLALALSAIPKLPNANRLETLYFASIYDPANERWLIEQYERTYNELDKQNDALRRRLESRCLQFLDLHRLESTDRPMEDWSVSFMHRTVLDFLNTQKTQEWLFHNVFFDHAYIDVATALGAVAALFHDPDSPKDRIHLPSVILFIEVSLRFDENTEDSNVALRAVQQISTALSERSIDNVPFVDAMDLRVKFHSLCEQICHVIRTALFLDLWSKYALAEEVVANAYIGVFLGLLSPASEYHRSLFSSQTTDVRADFATIGILSNTRANSSHFSLLEGFCRQDPSFVKVFWSRLLSILIVDTDEQIFWSQPTTLRYADEYVDIFLLHGANPNVAIRPVPTKQQQMAAHSALHILHSIEQKWLEKSSGLIGIQRAISNLKSYGAEDFVVSDGSEEVYDMKWELHDILERCRSRRAQQELVC